MTNKTYKKIFILLAAFAVLAIGGYVAALNGYFGGGAAIPEDTMTRGLVGYWSFDEGAGQTANDLSGNGNNGTLGAAATAGSDDPLWTKGKNGGALKFDGKNDYVNAGNGASLNITNAITLEAWVKTNSIAHTFGYAIDQNIFDKGFEGTATLKTYSFGVYGDDIRFLISTSGANTNIATKADIITTGNWYHVVGTYDNSSAIVYVNGIAGTPLSLSGNIFTNINSGNIGRSIYSNSRWFNGSIDEVRIYNRALSAAEVRYHYNRGGPVAEWKFDEGSGTTVYDSTENNKDGVLHE